MNEAVHAIVSEMQGSISAEHGIGRLKRDLLPGVKDPVEISVRGETILLSRPQTMCVFCGRAERLSEYRGRCVCGTCIGELKSAAA